MKVMWEKRIRGDDGNRIAIGGLPKQPLRILVVDDYPDCAVSLSFLCRLWGYNTHYCFDSASALQSLAIFKPNVFLLDIAMPLMDGYELALELCNLSSRRDDLFIAVTGYADAGHRVRGLGFGFDHYLAKGSDPSELKSLLLARESWLPDRALLAACVN